MAACRGAGRGGADQTVTGTPQGGVISPLLANIYLHAFDRAWAKRGVGEVVRYEDDFVVLCSSREQAEEAQRRATAMLGDLGLELHPDKTRAVDLRKEGFDFLGCRLHARLSGRMWEHYFCTDNASVKFRQLDRHVGWRLKRSLIKKRGRNPRAGQAARWTKAWFHDQGLYKLLGTIRYPKAA